MANIYGSTHTGPQTSVPLVLSISGMDLAKKDKLSESDPICIVFEKVNDQLVPLGKTEHLINAKNPQFAKTISINYQFEKYQPLLFVMYDVDDESKVDHHKFHKGKDLIGSAECLLGEIVGGRGGACTLVLKTEESPRTGVITIKALEAGSGNKRLHGRFSATKVDKKDFFSASDPYFVIKRAGSPQDLSWTSVHKSEVIKDDLNPKWKPFDIEFGKLCGGNEKLPLKIEVFDWDSDGKDDLIGEFVTSVSEMRTKKHFDLIEPKIQAKKGSKYKNSGVLNIDNFDVITIPTFLDFVTGGTEISLVVGIDYTASNGQPNESTSLHYINPNKPNEYMQAIRLVGDILAPYDNDGKIPAYGFGAFINATKQNLHMFPINGVGQNPECVGVWGVLQAYMNSFSYLQLSGPTNFAEIIRSTTQYANQAKQGERYTVLLMITDGVISDMDKTIEEIRAAAKAPMSIVIIGVGAADFSKMDTLDNDGNHLKLARDLVQFVPFRKYANNPAALGAEVLREIPAQLCTHYQLTHISPRPRPQPTFQPVQHNYGPPQQGFQAPPQQGFQPPPQGFQPPPQGFQQ